MSQKPLVLVSGKISQADTASIDASTIGYDEDETYPENTLPAKIPSLFERIEQLEIKVNNSLSNFEIVYINKADNEEQKEITANQRHIVSNPFPRSPVITRAEIFYNNMWAEAGYMYDRTGGGAAGVKASHILETDEIIVVTGSKGVGNTQSNYTGSTAGTSGGAFISSALCRVKIFKF